MDNNDDMAENSDDSEDDMVGDVETDEATNSLAILADLKKPASFKDKLHYLFGPPGWSHDGSKKTSRQLREESNTNKAFKN